MLRGMETTVLAPATIYESARAAFQPVPGDNPECVPFYAAWAGVRAVCDAAGIDLASAHHLVHQALGWSDNGRTWEEFTEQLRREVAKVELPKLTLSYTPHEFSIVPLDPDNKEDTYTAQRVEDMARAIFKEQHRQAYPGERVNSKTANERWKRLAPRAREMAREKLRAHRDSWLDRKARHEEKESKVRAEWQARVDEIERMKGTALAIANLGAEK